MTEVPFIVATCSASLNATPPSYPARPAAERRLHLPARNRLETSRLIRPAGFHHDGHPIRPFPVSRTRLEIKVSSLARTPGLFETASRRSAVQEAGRHSIGVCPA